MSLGVVCRTLSLLRFAPPLYIPVSILVLLIRLLKLTGYRMHQEVEHFNNCTLCPRCVYVVCIYLRTNSGLCHLQHKLIGSYNRDEKCLQRGTDWVFK
jgi:hypothetical protein